MLSCKERTPEPDICPAPALPRRYGSVMTLLVPIVTAPFRANARPRRVALSTNVMLVRARMLPCHFDAVPIVAELPTCQYTFLACAPLIRTTSPAVVSDVPAWKT